jgi:tetratricopeptide (TPR) repeat protein
MVPWQITEPMAAAAAEQAPPFPAYEPVPLSQPPAPEGAAYEAPAYEPPRFEVPAYEPPLAPQVEEAPVYAVPAYEQAPEPFFEALVAEASVAEASVAEVPAAEASAGDDLEATATLGDLYLLQGHTAEAEEIFRRVLDRDPDNATALAGLRRMRALSQDWFTGPASVPAAPEPVAPEPAAPVPATAELESVAPLVAVAATSTESVPPTGGDRRSWVGRSLTAADLLAGRSATHEHPEGLTAKKILVLKRYLQHLRTARPSYVQ